MKYLNQGMVDTPCKDTAYLTGPELVRVAAENKVRNYSHAQCEYGIKDCHETLAIGQYPYEHPYAQKLWAEIDAMRERMKKVNG